MSKVTLRELQRRNVIRAGLAYVEFGGLDVDQARRLKELEQENGRLKRVVADQALDISILKEVSQLGRVPAEKSIRLASRNEGFLKTQK